jgi:hypothetical protein
MDGVFNYLTQNAGLSDEELVRDMEQFFTVDFRWT